MTHCCQRMEDQVTLQCDDHPDPFDCPDRVVVYSDRFDEYGLIVHDGGSSSITILFCPWCGTELPESKRERWFSELESLGFTNPILQDIPDRYRNDKWYRS